MAVAQLSLQVDVEDTKDQAHHRDCHHRVLDLLSLHRERRNNRRLHEVLGAFDFADKVGSRESLPVPDLDRAQFPHEVRGLVEGRRGVERNQLQLIAAVNQVRQRVEVNCNHEAVTLLVVACQLVEPWQMSALLFGPQAQEDLLGLLSSEKLDLSGDMEIGVVGCFVKARAESVKLLRELDLLADVLAGLVLGGELVLGLHEVNARDD